MKITHISVYLNKNLDLSHCLSITITLTMTTRGVHSLATQSILTNFDQNLLLEIRENPFFLTTQITYWNRSKFTKKREGIAQRTIAYFHASRKTEPASGDVIMIQSKLLSSQTKRNKSDYISEYQNLHCLYNSGTFF